MMKPLEHEHGNEGCPNLDPKRVLARSDKRLYLQVLFQRLEEQLNLPAVLVD